MVLSIEAVYLYTKRKRGEFAVANETCIRNPECPQKYAEHYHLVMLRYWKQEFVDRDLKYFQ